MKKVQCIFYPQTELKYKGYSPQKNNKKYGRLATGESITSKYNIKDWLSIHKTKMAYPFAWPKSTVKTIP
jgi:hypothetical protein